MLVTALAAWAVGVYWKAHINTATVTANVSYYEVFFEYRSPGYPDDIFWRPLVAPGQSVIWDDPNSHVSIDTIVSRISGATVLPRVSVDTRPFGISLIIPCPYVVLVLSIACLIAEKRETSSSLGAIVLVALIVLFHIAMELGSSAAAVIPSFISEWRLWLFYTVITIVLSLFFNGLGLGIEVAKPKWYLLAVGALLACVWSSLIASGTGLSAGVLALSAGLAICRWRGQFLRTLH